MLVEHELMRVKGIGPVSAERLINAGITTIEQIANSRPEELAFVKGIGIVTAKKIKDNARYILNFEKGLSIVLDKIRENFGKTCPKCGGEMDKHYIIINITNRIQVSQCKVCKFYLPV